MRTRLLSYLLLLLFLLIAYLPLSSFLFALKNDALTVNFPNKYFFSASLHSAYLPLWNPYINFGLPLYADPGFAFWNPLTWIFGSIGYSIPMLSAEILVYIWLGGIAMFELGIWLEHSRRVSFCMGAAYMCCGFFIGNLQHINFLTSAAFLPFVVKTYLDLHQSFTVRKFFFCMASIYMMAAGGHPAIPIACLYFMLLIQAAFIIFKKPEDLKNNRLWLTIRTNVLLLAGFAILAAPLLFSYYEFYPFFTRSAAVNQHILPDTGFDLSSYLSFLFPFATTGNNIHFGNDLLMRNGYFSLTGLICFLIALSKTKNYLQKIFLFAGCGMLLLSLGGPIKESIYSALPLLDHIRTNGEFRVFGIFSFILVGAVILEGLMKGDNGRLFDRLLISLAAICLLLVVYLIFRGSLNGILPQRAGSGQDSLLNVLKDWLYKLSFSGRLLLNAALILILTGFYFLIKTKYSGKEALTLFILVDLVALSWIQLPVTGVQIMSPVTIQQLLMKVPPGIPVPRLLPLYQNKYSGGDFRNVLGCWSYYSKQPGTPSRCSYPTGMNLTASYFNSTLPDSLNQGPFLFVRSHNAFSEPKIRSFLPTDIEIRVETESADSLILLQNHYFRWKSMVNGKPVRIVNTNIAFMAVPLDKGINVVRFSYNNKSLMLITLISVLAWMCLTFYSFSPVYRK